MDDLNYIQYKNGQLKQNFLDDAVFPALDEKGIGQSQKQIVETKLAAFGQEEIMVYGEMKEGLFVVFAVMFNGLMINTKETKTLADYLDFGFEDVGDTYKINQIEKMKLEV